jgi:hypothetical protein
MVEEGYMYNPNKKEVDVDKFWKIADSIPQRFADLGTVGLIRLIQKTSTKDKDTISDAKADYEEIINDLYKERIKELIEELTECIE